MKKRIITAIALILFCASAVQSADELIQLSPNKNQKKVPVLYQPYQPSKNEVVFNQSKIKINIIDPTPETNRSGASLPGARGAGQLVIYTPAYGKSTGTNEFGAEAIVEENVVTGLSGADSSIPPNGIVISGHGRAKDWMNSNLSVGTRVYIDGNSLYAYTTSESYIFESVKKICEAEQMIEFYSQTIPNYSRKVPNSYISDAKEYLKKAIKDPEQVQQYSRLAIEAANDAIKSVIPYKNGELRGVWVRPSEKTAEDIVKSVEKIQAAGIDNIFLETYFHGKTIFPSKTMRAYGFVQQYEQFDGIDPLKIWISEAHSRNMKVHIWFESFYVGNNDPKNNPNSILSVKPEWGNKTKTEYLSGEPTKSISEHNGYFLDPANPAVQDFLMKLIFEIVSSYKPDGINLDYIRYPNIASGSTTSWGYTTFARKEFKKTYGADPVEISAYDQLWANWQQYRCDKVSAFVKRVGEYGKSQKIYTSVVIFPDRFAALNMKHQDWKTWSEKSYINGFTPLFLTCDPKMASSMMRIVMDAKSSNTDFFAGLFVTFMNGAPEDLIRQIHEARKLNANGVIIFDYAHLAPKYSNALSSSVFSPKSAPGRPEIQPPPRPKEHKKKRFLFWKKR